MKTSTLNLINLCGVKANEESGSKLGGFEKQKKRALALIDR